MTVTLARPVKLARRSLALFSQRVMRPESVVPYSVGNVSRAGRYMPARLKLSRTCGGGSSNRAPVVLKTRIQKAQRREARTASTTRSYSTRSACTSFSTRMNFGLDLLQRVPIRGRHTQRRPTKSTCF